MRMGMIVALIGLALVSHGPAWGAGTMALNQNEFLTGMNAYAQSSGRTEKLVLKSTNSDKAKSYRYVLDCVGVIGMAKAKDDIINEFFINGSACAPRDQPQFVGLVAAHLARTVARQTSKKDAEQAIQRALKALDKAHKKQAVTIDGVAFNFELSDILGIVAWIE